MLRAECSLSQCIAEVYIYNCPESKKGPFPSEDLNYEWSACNVALISLLSTL